MSKDDNKKRGRYKRIPIDAIVNVYCKKAGNMSATAAALNISRETLREWRKDDPDLDVAMNNVDESLIDFSESKLLEAIQEGNLTAIIFHLKTKGRKRGYVERTEQDISMNAFEQLMKQLPDDE